LLLSAVSRRIEGRIEADFLEAYSKMQEAQAASREVVTRVRGKIQNEVCYVWNRYLEKLWYLHP